MRVNCAIEEKEVENDDGLWLDGVEATCSRCKHVTTSAGTGEASIRRCMALMREECPRHEANFYEPQS